MNRPTEPRLRKWVSIPEKRMSLQSCKMPFLTEAQRRPISASLIRANNPVRSPARTPRRTKSQGNTNCTSQNDRAVRALDADGHEPSEPCVTSASVIAANVDPYAIWERQIVRWLASRGLPLDVGDAITPSKLSSQLQDGVLLGKLLEGLDPGLRLTGFNRKARSRAAALSNLELVLAAVWRRAPLARDMPSAEEVRFGL